MAASRQVETNQPAVAAPRKTMTGGTNLAEIRQRAFYTKVTAYVYSAWVVPPTFKGKGLKVIVSATINRNGDVIKTKVEESSGSGFFDSAAEKALLKASPLPAIPSDLDDETLEIGFRFSSDD